MVFTNKRESTFISIKITIFVSLTLVCNLSLPNGILLSDEKNEISSIGSGKEAIFLADLTIGKIIFIRNDGLILNTKVPFGSLIKPFTLYYGLSSGMIDTKTIYFCRPSKISDPPRFRCWYTPGHGRLNSIQALTQSCNSAFMKMAAKIEWIGYIKFLDTLEFDTSPLLNIKDPLMRQTIMTGLDDSLVESPANLALKIAAMMDGILYRMDANYNLEIEKFITLDKSSVENIRKGMMMSMIQGHSKPKTGEQFLSIQIIAKTGTIGSFERLNDTCRNKKNNGFFVALFQHDQRKYLLAAVVMCGIGDDAARLGREIISGFISSNHIQ